MTAWHIVASSFEIVTVTGAYALLFHDVKAYFRKYGEKQDRDS
jgi:hypothetical protein